MQRVFVMYKLKDGVSVESYKKWSREVDQKITPKQPGIHRFDVYEIKGGQNGEAPYHIVEVIDVENWEVWQKVLKSEAMNRVTNEWGNYGDESSVVMIYGEKI